MSDVAIAGVGLHPFGRFEDRSITDMGAHAVQAALREAGVADRRGIQATFCGTAYGGVAAGHKVLGRLSMTGGPIVDVEAGCASGGRRAHARGRPRSAPVSTTRVLVFGIEKMPKGIIRSSFFEPWREQAGLAATPGLLRAARPTPDARVGLDQGRPRRPWSSRTGPTACTTRTPCSARR